MYLPETDEWLFQGCLASEGDIKPLSYSKVTDTNYYISSEKMAWHAAESFCLALAREVDSVQGLIAKKDLTANFLSDNAFWLNDVDDDSCSSAVYDYGSFGSTNSDDSEYFKALCG